MNADYQLVAAGAISPFYVDVAESLDGREIRSYQEKRRTSLKKIEKSNVVVGIATVFPSYQSLGDGAWRHQLVERVYKAVVAKATGRLQQVAPGRFFWPPKTTLVHLAWDRLHDNRSGKPVYVQRWYVEKDHAALLGCSGRLGEEVFADIVWTTWHAIRAGIEVNAHPAVVRCATASNQPPLRKAHNLITPNHHMVNHSHPH